MLIFLILNLLLLQHVSATEDDEKKDITTKDDKNKDITTEDDKKKDITTKDDEKKDITTEFPTEPPVVMMQVIK